MSKRAKYSRILLKLSGEALAGDKQFGIESSVITRIAEEIKEVVEMGVEVAVVVGGGNFFRGVSGSTGGMDRASADYVGMLATVMNSLLLQSTLEKLGVPTRVQSAITMNEVAEPFIRRRAIRHLEKKRVVILAAGTGNPFFTTDTTAALRANELGIDVVLKATKVDGIYDKDPKKYPDAKKYDSLSYLDVLNKGLEVMDSTATTLCMDNKITIIVFDLGERGNIARIIKGDNIGTVVK